MSSHPTLRLLCFALALGCARERVRPHTELLSDLDNDGVIDSLDGCPWDAAKVEPGQRGKLLLSADFKTPSASKSKQLRAALASLPTIPFVIVEP